MEEKAIELGITEELFVARLAYVAGSESVQSCRGQTAMPFCARFLNVRLLLPRGPLTFARYGCWHRVASPQQASQIRFGAEAFSLNRLSVNGVSFPLAVNELAGYRSARSLALPPMAPDDRFDVEVAYSGKAIPAVAFGWPIVLELVMRGYAASSKNGTGNET